MYVVSNPGDIGELIDYVQQRMKAEGKDILNPTFSSVPQPSTDAQASSIPGPLSTLGSVCMTKPGVDCKITVEEFRAQDKHKPWVSLTYRLEGLIVIHSSLWSMEKFTTRQDISGIILEVRTRFSSSREKMPRMISWLSIQQTRNASSQRCVFPSLSYLVGVHRNL